MVSFSCEACGDILTKKKLDPHRNQCRGASFTCIDCMVHFWGTDYRSHTSCMTEDQKYQGALYREKPPKGQRGKGQNNQNTPKQNAKSNPNAHNQQPRVDDATSDGEVIKANIPPPPAPSPPPTSDKKPTPAATKSNDPPVNVFDYLVTEDTPNASKYPSAANASMEFVTPAPKKKKERREKKERAPGSVSEKKRKRGQVDQLSSPQQDIDTPMMDAPSSVVNNAGTPVLAHSGLTGGLNRMMRSPSHEIDETPEHGGTVYQDASSPIKRTRRNGKELNGGDPGLGITIKNRAERLVSSMFGGTGSVVSNGSKDSHDNSRALVRARRGSSSSADGQLEIRKKKSHRSRNVSDSHAERKSKRKSSNPTDGDRPSRRQKQIDERRRSDSQSPHRDHQVTVYRASKPPARSEDVLQREMATHFLSLVSRDSERGCSFNKALKRFHRDFADEHDDSRERRGEDEKDLWRGLRLRRNDRGEIVVFA